MGEELRAEADSQYLREVFRGHEMIQVRLQKVEVDNSLERNNSGEILNHLAKRLDREKFFGNILLHFKNGELVSAKIEQTYSVPDLLKTLNSF